MLRIGLFALIMMIGVSQHLAVVTPKQPLRFSNDFVYPSDARLKSESSESSEWALPLFEIHKKESKRQQLVAEAAAQSGKSNVRHIDNALLEQCLTAATPTHARLLLIRYSNERINNVLDYMYELLTDELEMNRMHFSILQANFLRDSNNILFEMATIGDANQVLQHYCKLLHELKEMPGKPSVLPFEIVSTEQNFHNL